MPGANQTNSAKHRVRRARRRIEWEKRPSKQRRSGRQDKQDAQDTAVETVPEILAVATQAENTGRMECIIVKKRVRVVIRRALTIGAI
ncbi:hypothetical protein E3P81_03658 [Wallemia ichthyophaga]|nr:hypothetical protein E3P97_03666 [Wallemia ichthyophaga]TIB05526.1 hypothetical protein E3P96_01182 [Wallemia ichthyophaga]TIB28696.1 hypothetical protein E3P85_03532 [Wallemia ichthyophaga]TIB44191.1 hypothetical protein E3P82_03663 [Wallemia ichthyophaga]TIB46460.1 hypothetical protein E3P81_03658 [Wallemia ichthyophaga]